MRYEDERAEWVFLIDMSHDMHAIYEVLTSLLRRKARSSLCATVDAFCRIASLPNH
jgi:hypothetical protein